MYEAMAGKAPFADREENVAKIYAHLQDEPPWLPGEGGNGGSLDEVISRALAKEPKRPLPVGGRPRPRRGRGGRGRSGPVGRAQRRDRQGRARDRRTGRAPVCADPRHDRVRGRRAGAGRDPEPAATEPFAVTAESTAEYAPPTRALEAEEPPEPPAPPKPPADEPSAPKPRSSGGGPRWGRIGLALAAIAAVIAVGVVVLGGGGSGDSDGATGFAPSKVEGNQPTSAWPVGVAVGSGIVAVAARDGQKADFFKPGGRSLPERRSARQGSGGDDRRRRSVGHRSRDQSGRSGSRSTVTTRPRSTSARLRTASLSTASRSGWPSRTRARSRGSIPRSGQASDPVTLDGTDDAHRDRLRRRQPLGRRPRRRPGHQGRPRGSVNSQQAQDVGDNPKGVVVGDGVVWVANTDSSDVDRFTTDLDELDPIDVGGEPRLIAAGFGRIWVANGENTSR